MGGKGHQLEEGGRRRNDPEDLGAPLDSGADGGAMDDASMGPGPADAGSDKADEVPGSPAVESHTTAA